MDRLTSVPAMAVLLCAAAPACADAGPLPAPTGVRSSADASGLAVSLSWDAVPRAVAYHVHRGDGPAPPPADDAHLLATTSDPAARDLERTPGRTLTYVVTAVGSGTPASPPSPPTTVSTSADLRPVADRAADWLSAQQEPVGLVRSFHVPPDDPQHDTMARRAYLYDQALAVMSFAMDGRYDRSRAVLDELTRRQGPDGSLPFSFDVEAGRPADAYRRTGAMAWAGTAAVDHERRAGDTRYRAFAGRLADHLLTLQVTEANGYPADDPRSGAVLGGRGSYGPDGTYVDEPVTFASTEHNIDAYFFLRDLAEVSGTDRYRAAAGTVRDALLRAFWNADEGHFDQGIGDPALALDAGSWGGLFLLAVGEDEKAHRSARHVATFRVRGAAIARSVDPERYNQTYASDQPVDGYQPYRDSPAGYQDAPETVWAEGTAGALMLRLRLGEDISGDLTRLLPMQVGGGGFLQVTTGRRSAPYEFATWPAVGGTAWVHLLLRDPSTIFRPDR